jgi:hypothetical protein
MTTLAFRQKLSSSSTSSGFSAEGNSFPASPARLISSREARLVTAPRFAARSPRSNEVFSFFARCVDDDEVLVADFAERDVPDFAIVVPRIALRQHGAAENPGRMQDVEPSPSLDRAALLLIS